MKMIRNSCYSNFVHALTEKSISQKIFNQGLANPILPTHVMRLRCSKRSQYLAQKQILDWFELQQRAVSKTKNKA
jgi:hypothetical protein